MNRSLIIILTTACMTAGFAAGWFTGTSGLPGLPIEKRGATTGSKTPQPPPVAVPGITFPELGSVADCREFLGLASLRYKDRHPLLQQAVRDYALRRWLELDAESALAEAERAPGEEYSSRGFANDLFRVWLDLNEDSAISAWHQASPALARTLRYSFLKTLAEKDGPKALAECRASLGVEDRWDWVEKEVLRIWASYDPRAAAGMSLNSESNKDVLDEWMRSDPAAAAEWIRERNDMKKFGRSLLPWLLKTDPAAASELVNGPMSAGVSDYRRQTAAREWAKQNLEDALRWAESQPVNGLMVREVLNASVRMIAYSDPDRALEIMQRLSQPTLQRPEGDRPMEKMEINGAWREIFASMAATDPDRARELVMKQPADSMQSALNGYFTHAFAADPGAAIAQCREWLADPAVKDTVLAAFADSFRWGQGAGPRDPSAALAAIPEFADAVDADVLSGWAKTDPRGAAEWIAQRTASGNSFKGLKDEGVITDIAISEPVWTASWLRTLTDTSLQNEAADTLTANWAAFDPVAARQWIESLPEGPLREAAESGFNRRNGQ